MQDVRLTVKKRAFPSRGRVRLNSVILPDLGIADGGKVDLVNESTKKSVSVMVIADTMVPSGQIRISEEDLTTIGIAEGEEVLVKKTPPLQEKLSKAAAGANKTISAGTHKLDEAARKTAGEVKKETKKASTRIEKAAAQTAKDVKKTVKKVTGKGDDL